MKRDIHCVLFAGLLSTACLPAFAASTPDAANTNTQSGAGAGTSGSALPPGTNPTTPSGGNGGDAAGYDHMPKAGEGTRVDKPTDADNHEKQKHNDDKSD